MFFSTAVRLLHNCRHCILVLLKRRFYHINALLYMELPGLPAGQPVVVINAVCNITALLGLQHQGAALYGMDASGINLKKVSLTDRNFPYEFLPAFFLYHLLYFILITCMVPNHNGGIRIAVQDIPAFCLAQRSVFMLPGVGIIRMNLYA